jgi:2-amino-4-hydroxy-6-hydroxymethyldihydropteridine diphosphokinase
MPEVFVGLGSNIEPTTNLRWVLRELGAHFGPLRCSSVYRSPAFGFEGPDFLNMVVGFDVETEVEAVEATLSGLENARGRSRAGRTGSRSIDLDLLTFGQRVDAASRLPREDVLRYPFVLAPLAELAPRLRHPVTGEAVADAWDRRSGSVRTLTLVGELDAA